MIMANYVFNYYQNFGNLSSLPSGWSIISGTSITYASTYIEVAPSSNTGGWYGISLNPIPSALSTPLQYGNFMVICMIVLMPEIV